MTEAKPLWRLWVDTGGTFTDCVAVAPSGETHRAKVLSSGRLRGVVAGYSSPRRVHLEADWSLPDDFLRGAEFRLLGREGAGARVQAFRTADRVAVLDRELRSPPLGGDRFELLSGVEAPLLAAHWLTRTPLRDPLPPIAMRLATTRGTNALLERRGSPTALFTTRGFADLLRIGSQQRPELFSLAILRPQPLYEAVIEVDERLDAGGQVLRPLALGALAPAAEAVLAGGIRAAAVALMHSYRNPRHERQLESFLLDLGFDHVSRSSRLAPLIKIVPRAETAVVNAYLAEVIGGYLENVGAAIGSGSLHALTSTGGLVRDRDYLPKDSLLSGPAGGVVGAAASALEAGFERSLAFDMGGTSTDVSRYDGEFDYQVDTRVGDAHLLAPCLAIETVAAGGGSICHFDGRQLKVGPQSAGADPGAACYGSGGPLTLTDVNLLLGLLQPESFEIPIDIDAARRAAADLTRSMGVDGSQELSHAELLQGLLDIANERMAEAIRRISIRQGYRPADFALVAFGGAGGQHACALAEILGIRRILVPRDAGLLSAVGLGRARVERMAERQVLEALEAVSADLPAMLSDLAKEASRAVMGEGIPEPEIEIRLRRVHLRLAGQETSLAVDFRESVPLPQIFADTYEDHYGYRPAGQAIEVESLRVLAASRQAPMAAPAAAVARRMAQPAGSQSAFLRGRWRDVLTFERADLRPGDVVSGPALVFERHCATVLYPDWRAVVDRTGALVVSEVDHDGGPP